MIAPHDKRTPLPYRNFEVRALDVNSRLLPNGNFGTRLTKRGNGQDCWPTTPSIAGFYMLRPFAHPVARCCVLLGVVAQRLKPVKLFSQQFPTFLLFRDRRSISLQCWIRSHSSSNIAGDTHAYHTWSPQSYGLYPSHDALQFSTLLTQQCGELLRPFASSFRLDADLRYREKHVVTISQLKPSSSKGG